MTSRAISRIAALAVVLAAGTAGAGEEAVTLADAPGRDLVAVHCVLCHSVDYVVMNAPVMTRARWESSVRKMIDKLAAPIGEADAAAIIEYLSQNYAAPTQK